MSDQTTKPADQRRSSDGKVPLGTKIAIGTGTTGGAATLLYLMGCLKGHQFYVPDDALALFWAGCLAPVAQELLQRLYRLAGVTNNQQADA